MKMRFFKLAEKLAEKSNHPAHKHGAVLVRKSTIIGLGFNQSKTHPKSNHTFRMIHAEFSAVLNSGQENLEGCEIYIVRKRKNGELANSKPCNSCERMLRLLSIGRVYYSTDTYFTKEEYDEV
jgi:deoxycytidylate deaminase